MAKKEWTDEERKAFGDKMKALREGKKVKFEAKEKELLKTEEPVVEVHEQEVLEEQTDNEILKQLKEL